MDDVLDIHATQTAIGAVCLFITLKPVPTSSQDNTIMEKLLGQLLSDQTLLREAMRRSHGWWVDVIGEVTSRVVQEAIPWAKWRTTRMVESEGGADDGSRSGNWEAMLLDVVDAGL